MDHGWVVLGALFLGAAACASAQDRFVAGESLLVGEAVRGDLIAAGGELRVLAPVGGDLVAAGGTLRLDDAVGQDLYAAGGQVSLDGPVTRNARAAGGSLSVGPKARIEGGASLAGGRVRMLGTVGGYLHAAGGSVLIDGPVHGDVEVAAGELEIGPRARIDGRLRYRSGEPARIDPGAVVSAGVERLPVWRAPGREREGAGAAALGVWTLGLMALAAVLVWALPGPAGRAADTWRRRFGWSALAGFIALAAVPPAVVVLLFTLVGIPLALLALLAYPALLLAGYVVSGIAVGEAALARWRAGSAARTGRRAAAAALGVLAIGLAALVPWLGWLVAFVALVAGTGALILSMRPAPRAAD